MIEFSDKYVRPIGLAANEFVELLISEFVLTRADGRTRLDLHFDDNTPCIWSRAGKRYVKNEIPDFKRKSEIHRKRLETFLAAPAGNLAFSGADEFPFRYVSGGALPVITMGTGEYYCLIYRECFPVGWNLANGGSDTQAELLNPFAVVERELREELLVLDPTHRHRYVFNTESDNPLDMPEYLVARRLWREHLLKEGWQDIDRFTPMPMPIKWLDGPDSLRVSMGDGAPVSIDGCYLNVRAEDFGIEVDRIAKMNLEDDAVLLDGELVNGLPVGSVVGLFEVQRMADLMAAEAKEFIPDIFFYDGRRYDGHKELLDDTVAKRLVPRIAAMLPEWNRAEWDECTRRYGLCPVAEGILDRATRLWRRPHPTDQNNYDVFICFAHDDVALAQEVFDDLTARTRLDVFFSRESRLSDYGKTIDSALESAKCLVAVGSSAENLRREWPGYEYRSFHMLLKSKRKTPSSQLISYLSGMEPEELPLPLFGYQAVIREREGALSTLRQFVMKSFS